MKEKMAIIGTGIAGMSAAYFLHKDYKHLQHEGSLFLLRPH